jgi:hypothetical protein
MAFMKIKLFLIVSIFALVGEETCLLASDIEWKLFLKPTQKNGYVLQSTTREGEPFVISAKNISDSATGYEGILEALDGTSFYLQKSPVSVNLAIHLILNVQGDSFESALGIPVCFNLKIEAYVNEIKEEDQNFFRNFPLVMTIPSGSGLNSLIDQCNCSRTEIVFAYFPGRNFQKEGIETSIQVSGMVAYIHNLSTIIGGKYSDLGFSSSTGYSTWKKIKTLFE